MIATIFGSDTTRTVGRWPVLREGDIMKILRQLRARDSTRGSPVYVTGGEMMYVGAGGDMATRRHQAADAYTWPIAHDVRPAAQSLGVRGCDDCHTTDSPFYFGSVPRASPYFTAKDSLSVMTDYQDQSPVFPWLFSMSFLFRPGLKLLIIISFLANATIVVIYAFLGLGNIIRTLSAEQE
jgi:hypothetical protein